MRAVVQRVKESSVTVGSEEVGRIGRGLMVLLGVARGDTQKQADYLAAKIINLRIFEDQDGKMNLSIVDTRGEVLIVSQFTLLADTRKGRRPSFVNAAPPDVAKACIAEFVQALDERGIVVREGSFGAHMVVAIENDGPVTILLESVPE